MILVKTNPIISYEDYDHFDNSITRITYTAYEPCPFRCTTTPFGKLGDELSHISDTK